MTPKKVRLKDGGYTLVEVFLAIFVFGLVSLGITATVLQAKKIAQASIMRSAAYGVVQGYMEQARTFPPNVLRDAIGNPALNPLPTMTISPTMASGVQNALEVSDPLVLGQENVKNILLDIDGEYGGSPVSHTMELRITPTVNDLSDAGVYGADALPAFEILMNFTYEVRHKRGVQTDSGSLQTIVADMS